MKEVDDAEMEEVNSQIEIEKSQKENPGHKSQFCGKNARFARRAENDI